MVRNKIEGMIAAAFTPMKENGDVDTTKIPAMVEYLISLGIKGLFVCGSTGEGPSLTTAERKEVAEAFVQASANRIPIFVHVGHNSIAEAKSLAAHAQMIGADYISATPPTYFKISTVDTLIECLAVIASGAPELPFYYYNIPSFSGVSLDMRELLQRAEQSLPTLVGIKYTTPRIHEFQSCLNINDREYDLLWGTDEMLLSALVVGAKGYIGSTYNFVAPLYHKLISAFDHGDNKTAAQLQMISVEMVRLIAQYGGLAAQKYMMKLAGMDCGPVRLPLRDLYPAEKNSLEAALRKMGFFNWIKQPNE